MASALGYTTWQGMNDGQIPRYLLLGWLWAMRCFGFWGFCLFGFFGGKVMRLICLFFRIYSLFFVITRVYIASSSWWKTC